MDSAQPGGGDELIRSIQTASAETFVEVLDISIDQLLESGLVKDLPVVGWLARLAGVAMSVRDRLLAKKIVAFLAGTSTASPEKVSAFLVELSDPKMRERAGETILMLIDRHERFEKSNVLGRLLAARIDGQFDGEHFLELAAALDRSSMRELLLLKRHAVAGVGVGGEDAIWALSRTGLVTVELRTGPPGAGVRLRYEINSLGNDMVRFGLTGFDGEADMAFA
jgi:hypothetical protein